MSTPTILQKIVHTKHHEIATAKAHLPLSTLIDQAHAKKERGHSTRGFAKALRQARERHSIGIISEIKKASPSKGIISPNFKPTQIGIGYQTAGATCLSVLTDRSYFMGDDRYLIEVRAATDLPVLRKDFMVDDYHIYESYVLGADCILLIMACLDDSTVARLHQLAIELGMDVLIEIHSQDDLTRALALPTSIHNIYGINNRDLNTFEVNLQHSIKLCDQLFVTLGTDVLVVSESGLNDVQDIALMQAHGIHQFLIGEQFMRSDDPAKALALLLEDLKAYSA